MTTTAQVEETRAAQPIDPFRCVAKTVKGTQCGYAPLSGTDICLIHLRAEKERDQAELDAVKSAADLRHGIAELKKLKASYESEIRNLRDRLKQAEAALAASHAAIDAGLQLSSRLLSSDTATQADVDRARVLIELHREARLTPRPMQTQLGDPTPPTEVDDDAYGE